MTEFSTGGVVAFVLVPVCISAIIYTFLLRRFSHLKSSKPKVQQQRWASQSKPALGGVGFAVVLLLAAAFVSGHLSAWDSKQWLGVGLTASLAFFTGLRDDLRGLAPKVKLLVQLACTALLLAFGIGIEVFDSPVVNALATGMWVIGLMNAVNMLDNMDGVATVTSMFTALFLTLASIWFHGGLTSEALLMLALVGSLFGFLLFNWHPARMYMGDGGSLLLGLMLAVVAIPNAWNLPALENGFGLSQALIPLLVFLMPIADTTVVTVNRLRAGISPSVGGRDHTTHNLGYLGFSDTGVAVTYSFISLINLCWALWILVEDQNRWPTFFALTWAAVVLLSFYFISRYNLRRGKYSYSHV